METNPAQREDNQKRKERRENRGFSSSPTVMKAQMTDLRRGRKKDQEPGTRNKQRGSIFNPGDVSSGWWRTGRTAVVPGRKRPQCIVRGEMVGGAIRKGAKGGRDREMER